MYGGNFDVYTNNHLTYILISAKLDAVGQCWVAALANYNFQLYYKTGKLNIEADALSWIPWHMTNSDNWDLDHLTVKAIIGGCSTGTPLIKAYTWKAVIPPQENASSKTEIDLDSLIMNQEWQEWQDKDKTITEITNLLKDKKLGQQKVHSGDSVEMKTILRHKHQFILRNGLLYKKIQFCSKDKPSLQFVLPASYR